MTHQRKTSLSFFRRLEPSAPSLPNLRILHSNPLPLPSGHCKDTRHSEGRVRANDHRRKWPGSVACGCHASITNHLGCLFSKTQKNGTHCEREDRTGGKKCKACDENTPAQIPPVAGCGGKPQQAFHHPTTTQVQK
ncbi:hypothetical protein AVEN_245757-1 [Araneus ventricosus]|uniref:Uncharacterized protein n=1 Tax=Araneus ventricosus TaxID=182803 RepID=A0A4Y2WTL5_ARAVE|nr:hypothetical protein AVEN_245757-1 [Araneus ventricosus]